MKLSLNTLNLLKNFATINDGILFKKGNIISTIAPTSGIVAKATVDEVFEQDFAIYSLSKFINALGLVEDPELIIVNEEKARIINSEGRRLNYQLADPSMVKSPRKYVVMDSPEVSFSLTDKNLKTILNSAGTLNLPNICVVGNGETITLVTKDVSNDAEHNDIIELNQPTNHHFEFVMKTENFKLIPGDYDVNISSKGVTHLKNKTIDLQYWILLDATSKFGE